MERHYFPLLHEQVVVVSWASVAPAQLLNMPVRVDILEEIDEARMLEAYRITVERLPYCRVRLHKAESGDIVQYISAMDEQTFCEVLDYSDKTERHLEKDILKWAATPFPNKLMDVQLHMAKLLRRRDGRHTLYFCAPHTIMDIYAVSFVVQYLDKVYYALTTGTDLPERGADPEILVTRDQAYIASPRCREDNEWWRNVMHTEPQFTSVNGVGSKEFIPGERYGKDRTLLQRRSEDMTFRVPAELVKGLRELALQDNMTDYMYYFLAVRTYLGAVCKTEDVTVSSLLLNRATLAEKTGGLSRANGFEFRTICDGTETFRQATKALNHQHYEHLRHLSATHINPTARDIFPRPEGTIYRTALLSYVSFVDYDKIHLKVRASKIGNGISIGGLYILIMPKDNSGDLWGVYQYALGYTKPESVEKLHNFMLRFLEAGVANPDATIRELTDQAMA